MGKLKVGVIGVGNISEFHIQAYQLNPQVELYAFCDVNVPRLQEMGEKYGVARQYTQMQKMLALPELDAVSVCTWNSAHAPCAIAALNAGKHVLCEKPMATSAAEAQEMEQAAAQNGKLLMIGFVRRFGSDFATMKEFVDEGYFGDIYYAKAQYLRRNGNPGGWFGDRSRSGGGPLIDLGVHVIDLTRCMMGSPKPVSVYGATFQKLGNRPHIKNKKEYASVSASQKDICDVEDLASAMIRYDNGAVLQIEASFSLNLKKEVGSVQFFGTKAGAQLMPDFEMYTEQNGYLVDVIPQKLTGDFNSLFRSEIDHFVACVRDGIPCRSPAADGITIMKILDAVYLSAETGHEVVID